VVDKEGVEKLRDHGVSVIAGTYSTVYLTAPSSVVSLCYHE